MGLKLFDGGDFDDEDVSKIEVNREYARRYEHNKKREDLQRLQELKEKGLVDDDDDAEDDTEASSDEELDESKARQRDLEFFNALIKVRNQDPGLKEKNISLFESEDSDGDEEKEKREGQPKEKKNKMYLKDVMAQHLIEEGPDFDDKQMEISKRKSYNEEQEEMRKAFLEAAEVDGDDDGFLRVKKRDGDGQVEADDMAEFEKKVDEYFGKDKRLSENEVFLRDFFLKKMWVDKDDKKKGFINEEELDELLRDEEDVEKQEDYEYKTNFRYEENAGDQVLGHSRTTEGSVRKKENARKNQRKSKEERMKAAEMERKEELKHLKNLKKEEIKEKLNQLKRIAGIGENEDCALDVKDLNDDFDPEEYDRMMKKIFDERYYNTEDVDPEFGRERDEDEDGGDIEKPDFDKEDELLGLSKGWDVSESRDGFLAARERSLKFKADGGGDDDDVDDDDQADHNLDTQNEESMPSQEGKHKRKRKLSQFKRAKEAIMEEYYKLDYEDTIGDLKTRFKYAKIKPNRFGLSTADILMMDDKELNQYVSMKKLAPFREKEWKVHDSKRYQLKMKKKELLEEEKENSYKKKRRRDDSNVQTAQTVMVEDGKPLLDGSNDDLPKLSKKAKRRRRQAEMKLSESRLMAYGKIMPRPKGKKKKISKMHS